MQGRDGRRCRGVDSRSLPLRLWCSWQRLPRTDLELAAGEETKESRQIGTPGEEEKRDREGRESDTAEERVR